MQVISGPVLLQEPIQLELAELATSSRLSDVNFILEGMLYSLFYIFPLSLISLLLNTKVRKAISQHVIIMPYFLHPKKSKIYNLTFQQRERNQKQTLLRVKNKKQVLIGASSHYTIAILEIAC